MKTSALRENLTEIANLKSIILYDHKMWKKIFVGMAISIIIS